MSSKIKHFSHPEHELILKEDDVIEENAACYVCDKTVIGFPTYTCTSPDDNIDCNFFYLHRSCAELPTKLYAHDEHNQHPITLRKRSKRCICDVCEDKVKFAYSCAGCNFDLCIACAFPCPPDDEQRMLCHEGHPEHTLVLQRQALFKCDACWEEAKDLSYICITCDFWIHKRCAFSPLIIPAPTYHHHPLHLIYSIPDIHRYFPRFCGICNEIAHVHSWLYYCHKCTYFVHMKCSTSTVSTLNENEAADSDNYPDLIEFPLHSEEALFDLFTTQSSKFQVDFDGVCKDTIKISTEPNDPHIIEGHWSHPKHPLEQLQFIISENDNDDDDDNTRVLLCDGCIRPISPTYPSFYGCIECGFFLHSVCATKLPKALPIGASPFHPQHSLILKNISKFYSFVKCGVCGGHTNGFHYKCETCDIIIDICCAFLPVRIKHKFHKHHPLVQRPSLDKDSPCSVSRYKISGGMEYACEICSDFQISILGLSRPGTMKHRYDDHPITLRYPPFFYEGVIYCEICEEQVNNQWSLFHCGECDHTFHVKCLHGLVNIKLGGTIGLYINNRPHILAYVYKRSERRNSPLYVCNNCRYGKDFGLFFECDGCGFLICTECVRRLDGE